uniref:Kazal-like domain-containing protein n=1 Tax=Chelonoidis abingdonii TaxID=106734 RepID=A0A8C0GLB8_CHEAB
MWRRPPRGNWSCCPVLGWLWGVISQLGWRLGPRGGSRPQHTKHVLGAASCGERSAGRREGGRQGAFGGMPAGGPLKPRDRQAAERPPQGMTPSKQLGPFFCPKVTKPVCGTNDLTYGNKCLLCSETGINIGMKHKGKCGEKVNLGIS